MTDNFAPIKRANKGRKFRMSIKAQEIAEENGFTFTGNLEPNEGAGTAYTAEFIWKHDNKPFYGWAIASVNNGDWVEEIDFVFGSGQQVFGEWVPIYVTTDEDYYETIGAGV